MRECTVALISFSVFFLGLSYLIVSEGKRIESREVTIVYYNGDSATLRVECKPDELYLEDGCLKNRFDSAIRCGVRSFNVK